MRRNLMLLLVSALLVYTLTGCGCASKDTGAGTNGSTGANSGTTTQETRPEPSMDTTRPDDSGSGTDGANTGDGTTVGPGESMLEDTGDAIRDGVDNAADAITGNDTAGDGVAIDDMLRNGRVRDN